jgi:hypothetical protein
MFVPSLCSILFFSRIQQQRHVAQLHSAEAPYECSRCHRRFKSDYRQAANIALFLFSLTDRIDFNCIGSGTEPTYHIASVGTLDGTAKELLGAEPVTHLARPCEAARLDRGHGLPPPFFSISPSPPPPPRPLGLHCFGTVTALLRKKYERNIISSYFEAGLDRMKK